MDISAQVKSVIRDVRDFSIQWIAFKDIIPLFRNINLFRNVIDVFDNFYQNVKIDKIVGIESRGFFVKTVESSYFFEYGVATIEIQEDSISVGENILIVYDIFATGGTVNASVNLIKTLNANVISLAFIAELLFLEGRQKISLGKQVEIFFSSVLISLL